MNRRRFLASALILPLAGRSLLHAGEDCRVKGAPTGQTFTWPTEPGDAMRLLLIGDWGTRGALQKRVAGAMESVAAGRGQLQAIISSGDNIYPSGVDSAQDPLWGTTFEDVYTGSNLQVPWISVLGNHDYRKSIMAQIDYGKKNKRWIMPSTYFSHVLNGPGETRTSLICLDTQQLLQQSDGWQDQMTWLKQELPKHRSSTWILVIGHHPMRSYGHYGNNAWMLKHLRPLLNSAGVDAYVCGHDHDLQIIKSPEDRFHCLVTGGGGGCRTTSWGSDTVAAATNGGFARFSATKDQATLMLINSDAQLAGVASLTPQHRS